MQKQTSDANSIVISIAPVIVLAALIILQGGFYPLVSCLVGIVISIVAFVMFFIRRKTITAITPVPLLFTLFACTYLVSSAANTMTLTELSESGRWFSVAAFAFLCCMQSPAERERAWGATTWLFVVLSVLGIAMFCGLVTPNGTMHEGRLQFLLQYANSAALIFAIGAFLCLLGNKQQSRVAFLPLLAMLATESAGVAAVFALAAICYSTLLLRKGRFTDFLHAVLQCITAFCLFLIASKIGSWVAFAAAIITTAAWLLTLRKRNESSSKRGKFISLAAISILAIVLIAVAILCTDRLAEACLTFAKRIAQMKAAAILFMQNPLVGIGPDNWQFLYPYAQDSYFRTKTVHCGYLQIADDGGLLSLAIFTAIIFIGFKKQLLEQDKRALLTAALILVHVAVDFDLRFTCIASLLAMCLVSPLTDQKTTVVIPFAASLSQIVSLLLSLAMCFAGVWASAAMSRIESLTESGEAEQAAQSCITTPFASRDIRIQNAYLQCLAKMGEWEAIASYGEHNKPIGEIQAITIAEAFIAMGDTPLAKEILETELKREPYNKTLQKNAYALLDGMP